MQKEPPWRSANLLISTDQKLNQGSGWLFLLIAKGHPAMLALDSQGLWVADKTWVLFPHADWISWIFRFTSPGTSLSPLPRFSCLLLGWAFRPRPLLVLPDSVRDWGVWKEQLSVPWAGRQVVQHLWGDVCKALQHCSSFCSHHYGWRDVVFIL